MLTLGLALLLVATDAPAAAVEPAASTAVSKPKKPKKICRETGPTGTRMSKKKCMTAEEWLEHDNAAQMNIDGIK